MTPKTKAAIEEAAKLPTAERILNDHLWMGTEPTEAQSAIIAAMQVYSDQQNAELRNQIADLERENSEYRAVYDSVVKNRDEMRGRLKELEAENEKLRKISDGYALLYEENERLKSELEEK